MLKKIALAAALTASFGVAHAYQAEINAGYEKTDMDYDIDGDLFFVNGKYYLDDASAKNAPLAEAAFLSKASSIGLGYTNGSVDKTILEVINAELEIQSYGISGEFFIPESQFYVAGSLNQTKFTNTLSRDNLSYEESDKITGYTLEAGYLPVDGLLVAVGLSKESLDPVLYGNRGYITSMTYASAADEDNTVSLRAKYVSQIGNYFTNFEGVSYFGDETAYGLGADLYIDPTLSVGVSFADSTEEDSDTIFGLRAQKFLTPALAVGVNYTTTDGADSYGINGTFRF
ncbi:putative porin [Acinetobacter sp. WCHAc010052]|uniref:putative porin n=1 Tax=Acinetobacter sp. WCHAc010052 TaxID=2004647 RepID=UPI000B3C6C76|nr:putative porin [Acinetobacter sp. WCHAc010052]AXY58779.1 putative porin [Acinetobacter sp. WCHAc010052]